MYTREEAEGRRLKNPFDTITEGIGINRLTENFKMAELDGAFRGTDTEAVEMSRLVLGLYISSLHRKSWIIPTLLVTLKVSFMVTPYKCQVSIDQSLASSIMKLQ